LHLVYIIWIMIVDHMGDFEAKVLYAVVHCGGDAYGVSISDEIAERTGDNLAMGAIYATLDRLQRKGFLHSSWSEPTSERGGRRKRLFRITGSGERALKEYDDNFKRMRRGWRPTAQEA